MRKKIEEFLLKYLCSDIMTENKSLKEENEKLKSQLLQRGNIFFTESKFLGLNKIIFGVVIDGECVGLSSEICQS